MKIRFHGAVEGVTGSCYELWDEARGHRVLIDCGMFQGEPSRELRNSGKLPYDPKTLTHVLLTHAHLDHVGMLPRLYREGYTGSVFTLSETAELATIVLEDAAKISGIYQPEDIKRIKWHEPSKAVFGNFCPIGDDLFVRFFRSGHILGAASITVVMGPRGAQRSITFSGDVGVNRDEAEVMPLLGYRMSPERADYLVIESTYGGVVREPLTMEDRLGRLKAAIDAALFERGGPVVMPAFAIGRTQELLCDLSILFAREPDRYAEIPVWVDSKLGRRAGRILADAIGRTYVTGNGQKCRNAWLGAGIFRALGLDKDDPDDMDLVLSCLRETLRPTSPRDAVPRRGLAARWRCITEAMPRDEADRREAPRRRIIISGSGMCDAGPVQAHLAAHLRDPQATILFSGYCGGGTLGHTLLRHGGLPEAERPRDRAPVHVHGEVFEARAIRAHITRLSGYSAHADQAGLLDWMWSARPGEPARCIGGQVFVTHGDLAQRRALVEAIERRAAAAGEAVTVEIPRETGEWVRLG